MKPMKVLVFFLLLVSQVCHAQTVIKLCYEDADNFPWHVKDGHGLNNNMIEMVAAKVGVKVEMVAMPWKRCLVEVGYGGQAGGFSASHNDERASYAAYPTTADGKLDVSRRMKFDGYSLYRRKGEKANWDGKQFNHLTTPVGVQLGYSVGNDLRKIGTVVEEAGVSAELQLKKLLSGRMQLVALLTFEGDDQMNEPEFAGKIEKVLPPFTEKPYFLIFNKDYHAKNKKLVEELWTAVATVRESKEFNALRLERMKK